MAATDNINQRYGLKTIRLAAEGDEQQPWKVKCEHRSPNYLTALSARPRTAPAAKSAVAICRAKASSTNST